MSVISIGKLRYDIVSDTSSFERGVKGSRREAAKLTKEWKESLTPMQRLQMRYKQLQEQLAAGKRGYQSFQYEQKKAYNNFLREERVISSHTRELQQNTRAVLANRAARRGLSGKDYANLAGAGLSGLGLGGAAAGAGRFGGLISGMGVAGVAAGAGFGMLAVAKETAAAFAEVERSVMSLKVVMGDFEGEAVADSLRKLAKETPLTSGALIRNAKVWASYGNDVKLTTQIMRRLGDVSGGNTEQLNALTLAMSQVVAQGKLMGQEKNQLINAGFSLSEVAKAAGISMDEFAEAMKNGEISSTDVLTALVNMTEEGGMFFQNMERQANTLSGSMDQVKNAWLELKVAIGESYAGPLTDFNKGLKLILDRMTQIVQLSQQIEMPGVSGDVAGMLPAGISMASFGVNPLAGLTNTALQALMSDAVGEALDEATKEQQEQARADRLAMMSDAERQSFLEAERVEGLTGQELVEEMAKITAEKREREGTAKAISGLKEELEKAREERKQQDAVRDLMEAGLGQSLAEVEAAYDARLEKLADMYDRGELGNEGYMDAIALLDEVVALQREEAKRKDDEERRKDKLDSLRDKRKAEEDKLKAIDKQEREDIAAIEKASQAAATFGPGSKEEYYFLRDKELADKKHQQIMAIQAKAQATRDSINTTLMKINRKMKKPEETDVESV